MISYRSLFGIGALFYSLHCQADAAYSTGPFPSPCACAPACCLVLLLGMRGRVRVQTEQWFVSTVDLAKPLGEDTKGRPRFRITYARQGSLPACKVWSSSLWGHQYERWYNSQDPDFCLSDIVLCSSA